MSGRIDLRGYTRAITEKSLIPFSGSISTNRKVKNVSHGIHQHEFEIDTKLLTDEQWRELSMFLKLQGGTETFQVGLGDYDQTSGAFGVRGYNIVADRAAHLGLPNSAGDTTIRVEAGGPATTGALVNGDFIKFSNHNKVYNIVGDVNTTGSTFVNFNINIFPALIMDVPNNTFVNYTNFDFTFYNPNGGMIEGSRGDLYNTTKITLREAL